MTGRNILIEKIICELQTMEIDGETMEYIINEVGMSEQMLRQLFLKEPIQQVNDLVVERVSLEPEFA